MIGQFFTPEQIVACMYRLLGRPCGLRLIDPSAGDGAFMKFAPKRFDLSACEVDPNYAAVLRKLLPQGQFIQGDALVALRDQLGSFDVAIGNPPFSAKFNLERRPEVLAAYELGVGRKSQCLEVLFLELFVKLVKPGGRIAIILPEGVLSNRRFHYVRRWLLGKVSIETIIGLPRNAFSKTSAKTYIVIAQRRTDKMRSSNEPTWMLDCHQMEDLMPLALPQWRKQNPNWRQVSLHELVDWRPSKETPPNTELSNTLALGEIFRIRRGRAQYAAQRELFAEPKPDRILLLRAKNLAPGGGLRLDAHCAYISRSGAMFHSASVVQSGEILFVRVGARCYGRTALVPDGLEAQADDWMHILTPLNPMTTNGAGIVSWLNSREGVSAVQKLATGVGTISISQASLAALRIPAAIVKIAQLGRP